MHDITAHTLADAQRIGELEQELFNLKARCKPHQEFSRVVQELAQSSDTVKMELNNWGMGIAGEGGEVVDILKKVVHHGHPMDEETTIKLMMEVGDVLFYLEALSNTWGFALSDCKTNTVNKLRKRYPTGKFTQEDSIKRNLHYENPNWRSNEFHQTQLPGSYNRSV